MALKFKCRTWTPVSSLVTVGLGDISSYAVIQKGIVSIENSDKLEFEIWVDFLQYLGISHDSWWEAVGTQHYSLSKSQMTTDAVRTQVAAKWQESFNRLNGSAPGISGLLSFSEVCVHFVRTTSKEVNTFETIGLEHCITVFVSSRYQDRPC